jgi:hypothetical protein
MVLETAIQGIPSKMIIDSSSLVGAHDGVWIVVEDGEFKGMTMITDRTSGEVVGLSARSCSYQERKSEFPSIKEFPSLKVIDLHNYRYLTQIHESIGDLQSLERLILTRCDLLKTLPSTIGNLKNLVEVRAFMALVVLVYVLLYLFVVILFRFQLDLFDSYQIAELPQEISGLGRYRVICPFILCSCPEYM